MPFGRLAILGLLVHQSAEIVLHRVKADGARAALSRRKTLARFDPRPFAVRCARQLIRGPVTVEVHDGFDGFALVLRQPLMVSAPGSRERMVQSERAAMQVVDVADDGTVCLRLDALVE